MNSSLGYKLADDKELTYKLLEREKLPIAKSFYLKKKNFGEFSEKNLENFRFPLVIKPTGE